MYIGFIFNPFAFYCVTMLTIKAMIERKENYVLCMTSKSSICLIEINFDYKSCPNLNEMNVDDSVKAAFYGC